MSDVGLQESRHVAAAMNREQRYEYVEALVAAAGTGELCDLLDESHPVYAGISKNNASRIKGYILASFASSGSPAEALPFILEELQNSQKPYLIGAAACALRGYQPPVTEVLSFLFAAIENLTHGDDSFSFSRVDPLNEPRNTTSAVLEILKTALFYGENIRTYWEPFLQVLQGGRFFLADQATALISQINAQLLVDKRDCCDDTEPLQNSFNAIRKANNRLIPRRMCVEDQGGKEVNLLDFVLGSPTVLAFFYTRCDNPNKCSLTITRLAQLQHHLSKLGLTEINLAAISYDSEYDRAHVLRNYCANRQFKFGERAKAFRVISDAGALRACLGLSVHYSGKLVSRHTVELYLLDQNGVVYQSYKRTHWQESEVIADIEGLYSSTPKKRNHAKGSAAGLYSVLYSVVLAFLPKCPLCLIAYFSAIGVSGVDVWAVGKWLLPSLILLLSVNLFALFRRSRKRNIYLPFYLTCMAIGMLAISKFLWPSVAFQRSGLVLIVAGAILNSVSSFHLIALSKFLHRIISKVVTFFCQTKAG